MGKSRKKIVVLLDHGRHGEEDGDPDQADHGVGGWSEAGSVKVRKKSVKF